MVRLGESIEGRPPTPEEIGRMQILSRRLMRLGRMAAMLSVIDVAAMASARFV